MPTVKYLHRFKIISERKKSILISEPSREKDTVIYKIPEALHPEFFPDSIHIIFEFGNYEAQFRYDQGMIIYVSKMSVKKGIFPAASYPEFQQFYTDIKKADQIKLVLKKQLDIKSSILLIY